MNYKKSKLTSINRLPSLYVPALIRSEYDYKREFHRKLDRLHSSNREVIRRCHANEHIFAHDHLTKRYQWFNLDKSFRDSCRTKWNKETIEKPRTSHIFLPAIYSDSESSFDKYSFQLQKHENSIVKDEKIKQKFLYVQPVMLEILCAPHSSQAFKNKYSNKLRKTNVQQRQKHIQSHAINDPRYKQLVFELQK